MQRRTQPSSSQTQTTTGRSPTPRPTSRPWCAAEARRQSWRALLRIRAWGRSCLRTRGRRWQLTRGWAAGATTAGAQRAQHLQDHPGGLACSCRSLLHCPTPVALSSPHRVWQPGAYHLYHSVGMQSAPRCAQGIRRSACCAGEDREGRVARGPAGLGRRQVQPPSACPHLPTAASCVQRQPAAVACSCRCSAEPDCNLNI